MTAIYYFENACAPVPTIMPAYQRVRGSHRRLSKFWSRFVDSRRRGRDTGCQAQGDLREGAENPGRGRAGGVAARTAVSDHHKMQEDLITTAIGVNDGFRDAWIDK